jgi:hypothetical protein
MERAVTARTAALAALKRQRPEWAPWLAVVEEALSEADAPAWEAAVPADVPAASAGAPLLAGASLSIDPRLVRNLLQRLLRVAARRGTPEMATLRSVRAADLDAVALFNASLCQERTAAIEAAAAAGSDAGASFDAPGAAANGTRARCAARTARWTITTCSSRWCRRRAG